MASLLASLLEPGPDVGPEVVTQGDFFRQPQAAFRGLHNGGAFFSGKSLFPCRIFQSPPLFPCNLKAFYFIALGNMSVTAGQAAKLVWHTPDPANPINEGLPDKVVVEGVAHWYSGQKYYCRIKGAVALEPL